MKESIFEKIKKLKIPYSTHCSDVYIPVNDITQELIESYEYKCNVTKFVSQIDNKLWYDIPFAFDDYKRT